MKYLRITIIILLFSLNPDFAVGQQANLQKTLRQAQLLKNRGLHQQAFSLYDLLYKSYPHNPDVVRGYTSTLNSLKMPEKVLPIYQSVGYELTFDDQVILLESFFLMNRNMSADSLKENILTRIRKVPLSSSLFNRLANVYIRYQHTEEAINILQEGYRSNPDAHYLLSTIGYLQKAQMQYRESVHTFLQYLEKQKSAFGLVSSHILSMKLDKRQSEDIYNLLKKTAEKYSQDVRYKKLLVEFLIKQQKYNEAISESENLPQHEYFNYLLNVCQEYIRAKKHETAFQILWDKDASIPSGQKYRYYDLLLKTIFGQLGKKTQLNFQIVNTIIKKIHTDSSELGLNFPTLLFKYIELYIAHTNDLDFGIRELSTLSLRTPNPELEAEIALMLGRLYRIKNRLAASDSVFTSFLTSAPVKYLPIIRFELIKNQLFRTADDSLTTHLDSLLLLIPPKDSLSNNVLKFMQIMNFDLSDSLKSMIFKGILLEEQKRYNEAATLFRNLFESVSGYEQFWCGIKSVKDYLRIRDSESAGKIIESILSKSPPDDIYQEISYTKALILLKYDQQPAAAKTILFELLEQFPNGKFNKQILKELELIKTKEKSGDEESI